MVLQMERATPEILTGLKESLLNQKVQGDFTMLQHNRQHIATRGFASSATARKLNTARVIAPHILAATIEYSDYAHEMSVVAYRAIRHQVKCGVELQAGQVYFMVRSRKFTD